MEGKRYLAVAYADELTEDFSIQSFAFRNYGPGSTITLYDLHVSMGYTDNTDLVPVFDSNYIPGTGQVVLIADSITLTAGAGEWCSFDLGTPFDYSPGHHLLIDLRFSDGSSEMHNFVWETPGDRSVLGYGPDPAQGVPYDWMIHLLLCGTELGLESGTFGSIKVLLGR